MSALWSDHPILIKRYSTFNHCHELLENFEVGFFDCLAPGFAIRKLSGHIWLEWNFYCKIY